MLTTAANENSTTAVVNEETSVSSMQDQKSCGNRSALADISKASGANTGALKKKNTCDFTIPIIAQDEFVTNGVRELTPVSEVHTMASNRMRSASAVNEFEMKSLDDELTTLRKRVEILKLEKEILEFGSKETQLQQTGTHFLFEDTAEFVRHLEGIFIDEIIKFLALKDQLTCSSHYSLTNDHQTPYNDVRAVFFKHFGQSVARPEIYQFLHKRQKKPNESVRQYILEMEAMAYRSDLAEFELVAFILNGLEGRILDYALICNAKSIAELKDAANILEYRETLRRHSSGPFSRKSKGQIGGAAASNRCYNCSKFGHFKSDCPYEDRPKGVCFKCWKADHGNKECENLKYVQQLKPLNTVNQDQGKSAEQKEPNVAAAVNVSKSEEVIPEAREDKFECDRSKVE